MANTAILQRASSEFNSASWLNRRFPASAMDKENPGRVASALSRVVIEGQHLIAGTAIFQALIRDGP